MDWVEVLEQGLIDPRASMKGEGELEVLENELLITDTGAADYVRFPHKAHTMWTGCAGMCHDRMFKKELDGTPMSMLQILRGKYCGRCHGGVAFPLTQCDRCHNTSPESVTTSGEGAE